MGVMCSVVGAAEGVFGFAEAEVDGRLWSNLSFGDGDGDG